MKLSFGERLSYALGDFSNNGAYMFVGTFLITFLTIGMGLSGKAAGAIIMCVTIFDAINDVIIGSLVDKAHGRGVKYTTFLRFAILPMAVLMVLCSAPRISAPAQKSPIPSSSTPFTPWHRPPSRCPTVPCPEQ